MDQDVSKTSNANSLNSNTAIKFVGISSGASTITLGLNGLSGTATDTILSYTTNTDETITISSGIVRTTKLVVKTSEINAQEWQTLSGNIVASINNSGYFAGFLASGVVNSESVLSGSIGTNQLASGVLQSVPANIQSGQITSGYLGNSSVNNININSGTIANDKLANNTITIAGSSTALGGSWAAAALTTASGLLAGIFYPSGALTIGIASGGVVSQMVSDNAIISGKVASGSLTTNAFASGTTFGTNITSGYITSGYLGNNSVISGSVGSGQIGIYHLASGTISTAVLGSGQIVSGNIASGQIGISHLASGVLASPTILSGTIVSGLIGNNAVNSGNVSSGSIGSMHIADGAVASGDIAANSIGSPHILSGSILNNSLANPTVTIAGSITALGGSWAAAALTTSSGLLAGTFYPSGALTIGIASGGITSQLLADGSVASGEIASGQIGTNHLASGTISTATLGSGQVVSGNIASGQIGASHLASGVLASPVILSGTIISGMLGNNSINSGNIASGSVGQFHHSSGSVASGHIGNFAVVNTSISSGTIANDKLANSTVTIAGSSTALGGSWAAAALTTASGLLAGTFYPSGALTIGIASGGLLPEMFGSGSVLSGSIASGQIGPNHLSSGALGIAGTSGMLQFNNGGVFGATSGLNYSMTSGNNFVNIQAQTAFNTTLAVKAASGQITNLQSWTNTSGSALAYMDASGNFFAVSKSFLINHPNKPGKKLRHVSLEGPSADVYYRGKSKSNTFVLPDYWKNLVDENNIDIILIPIGSKQSLYVEKIENLIVHVGGCEKPYYTFLAIAERIDMSKIVVEE